MDQEPYRGPNLGPLQGNVPPPAADDWSSFPEASQAKAADSWDAFPKASTAMDTAKDVAKSAGVGVAKGIISTAGLLGDLTDLGAKGIKAASDFVADKAGIDRYVPPEGGSVLNNIPTNESLTKNVEDVTGPLPKPETTAGHYAETVGEFLPAAVAGPGSFLRKVALQTIIPGVASEAAGQATSGTPLEPYARAAGAVAAGGAGALVGRPASSIEAIRKQLPQGITQATVDDARSLMQAAKAKGISLTWPEALSQSHGSAVLSDSQRILESAPGSRTRMQEFYADRPQQIDQAALNEFAQVAPGTATPSQIGPQVGEAAQGHIGDVRGAINKASEPYYKAAEGIQFSPEEYALINPNNKQGFQQAIDNLPRGVKAADALPLFSPDKFKQIETIPGYAASLKAVRNAPDAWRIQHLPDNSVGVLNKIKQHFDQQAKNAGSKFNPEQNQSVQSSHEMSASAVRKIGIAKSADYEMALAIQEEGRKRFLDPLLQGPLGRLAKKDITTQKAIDALFPSNPLPNSHNEIGDAVSALAAKNRGAAQQLVRAHVESVFNEASKNLQGGPNQFGGAKFANRLVGNIQQRANLEAAITALPNGKALWNGFDNFLEAVEATGTRQAKGSLTAFNAPEMKSLASSNMVGEGVKLATSPGKWWTAVSDKWSQWKLGQNLDELARIFTDPKSADVLKRIVAMPTGSREAAYLASRLILQSENALVQPREARRQ